MDIKRALIIASHPDDDILGCGGIMSKYKNKIKFKVIFIAEGSTCRFNEPDCIEAKNEIIKRNGYGIKALEYLDIFEYKFYNLPCGRLDQVPQIDINKIIEHEIKEFSADTIFTHSNCDSNKDHHKVYDATIIATRPGSGVKRVISYEVLSSSEWGFDKSFNPNLFVSLSEEDISNKCNALSCYLSEIKEFPYPRSKEGVKTLAKYRGMQSANIYAESFRLVRELI